MTKAKDSGKGKGGKTPEEGKGGKTPEEKKSRTRSTEGITCFVCGKGHFAKNCPIRKKPEAALVVAASQRLRVNDEDDGEYSDQEAVYLTTDERVHFYRNHVLRDNQASVNVFNNSELLTNIRDSATRILLSGIQAGATGVKVTKVGTFNELGEVYCSKLANANIRSFAAMIDRGALIKYDGIAECFTLKWPSSKGTYTFKRLPFAGSEGRFYVCNMGCWKSGRFTRNFFRVPKRSLHFRLLATLAQKRRRRSIR